MHQIIISGVEAKQILKYSPINAGEDNTFEIIRIVLSK